MNDELCMFVSLYVSLRTVISLLLFGHEPEFLPARASEQGNVIGLVSMSSKKIVIERTRDLIYLKFVAKDFSLKIISPSAGENSGDSA